MCTKLILDFKTLLIVIFFAELLNMDQKVFPNKYMGPLLAKNMEKDMELEVNIFKLTNHGRVIFIKRSLLTIKK